MEILSAATVTEIHNLLTSGIPIPADRARETLVLIKPEAVPRAEVIFTDEGPARRVQQDLAGFLRNLVPPPILAAAKADHETLNPHIPQIYPEKLAALIALEPLKRQVEMTVGYLSRLHGTRPLPVFGAVGTRSVDIPHIVRNNGKRWEVKTEVLEAPDYAAALVRLAKDPLLGLSQGILVYGIRLEGQSKRSSVNLSFTDRYQPWALPLQIRTYAIGKMADNGFSTGQKKTLAEISGRLTEFNLEAMKQPPETHRLGPLIRTAHSQIAHALNYQFAGKEEVDPEIAAAQDVLCGTLKVLELIVS